VAVTGWLFSRNYN